MTNTMQREDKIMKFTNENVIELLTEIVRLNIFDSNLKDVVNSSSDLPCTWATENLIRLFLEVTGLEDKMTDEQIDQVFGMILDVDVNIIDYGGNVYNEICVLWENIQAIK